LISLGRLNNYEILTETSGFYDMTLCNLSDGYQGFGGKECPHIQAEEGTRKFTVCIT